MTRGNEDGLYGFSPEKLIPNFAFINDEVNKITNGIENHFVSVAASINEALRTTPWLPDSIKPPPLPSSPSLPPPPVGYLEFSKNWISRHRAVTAAVVAFVGTSAFVILYSRRRRSNRAKRRARRAKNGSRTEVVVLAGSPYSPLTRSLSLDLERRGFIVYIPVTDFSEEEMVKSESRSDIRPLNLDITSPAATASTIEKFTESLARTRHPLPNTPTHKLNLAALLVLPPMPPRTGPISSVHPASWSDTLTTQLLAPFTTLHAFLPLLTTYKSCLLFLTPTIISSLMPASHGLENVAAGGMQSYINTAQKEFTAGEIHIVQLKLGIFDFGVVPMSRALIPVREDLRDGSIRQKIANVDAAVDAAATTATRPSVKGSPLRELHLGVFDAIVRERGRSGTMFVGYGSRSYDFISRWAPPRALRWMLKGMVRKDEQEREQRMRRWRALGLPETDDVKANAGRDGHGTEWERVDPEMGASAVDDSASGE
ncbi:hypothetical protein MMC07_002263 [Pseudocyphellaria aurata]|nr:hypothetical protein [Pseudocyphellaria aurata]